MVVKFDTHLDTQRGVVAMYNTRPTLVCTQLFILRNKCVIGMEVSLTF